MIDVSRRRLTVALLAAAGFGAVPNASSGPGPDEATAGDSSAEVPAGDSADSNHQGSTVDTHGTVETSPTEHVRGDVESTIDGSPANLETGAERDQRDDTAAHGLEVVALCTCPVCMPGSNLGDR